MPALYIGHGAPPLLDDPAWSAELAAWAKRLPRPAGVLIVSAHWESAPPGWSVDFDAWADEALRNGDVDALASYTSVAPGMPYAHPTVEHFTPLFITLGAAADPTEAPDQQIDGFWLGLSKRSFQVA